MKKGYSLDGIYSRLDYAGGAIYPCKGLMYASWLARNRYPSNKILCIGSSIGFEVVYLKKAGFPVTFIELFPVTIPFIKENGVVADGTNLPFRDKHFDFVCCFETLEHIKGKVSLNILRESKRVGKQVFFSIAETMDKPWKTHINLHPCKWWVNRFKEIGFTNIRTNKKDNEGSLEGIHPKSMSFSYKGQKYTSLFLGGSVIFADCE